MVKTSVIHGYPFLVCREIDVMSYERHGVTLLYKGATYRYVKEDIDMVIISMDCSFYINV